MCILACSQAHLLQNTNTEVVQTGRALASVFLIRAASRVEKPRLHVGVLEDSEQQEE